VAKKRPRNTAAATRDDEAVLMGVILDTVSGRCKRLIREDDALIVRLDE
jgi:hypothetical protein